MKYIYLTLATVLLQACTFQGAHRFTPTGIRIAPEIALGTEARSRAAQYYYEQEDRGECIEESTYVIGPQYYTLGRPIPPNYRSVKNYMNAPVVAETYNGSSVIIPRSWN